MKRTSYSQIDPFSQSPLLVLLPVRGKTEKLRELSSSFFAKHEKATQMYESLKDSVDEEMKRRMFAETQMLKQVLEWLVL